MIFFKFRKLFFLVGSTREFDENTKEQLLKIKTSPFEYGKMESICNTAKSANPSIPEFHKPAPKISDEALEDQMEHKSTYSSEGTMVNQQLVNQVRE